RPAAPPPPTKNDAARIDALIDGDVHDRLDHILGRDGDDGLRGCWRARPSGFPTCKATAVSAATAFKRMAPPRKEIGVRIAEHEGRVRDGRIHPAPAVAGWARNGASAARPYRKRASRI